MLASEIGDLEVIKCFVEHGADLDYSPSGKEADELNITGQTALFMATLKEQNDVVQYLIDRGSKVNVKNRYGVSPLLLCAEGGNETLVKLLVSVGADVNMSPSGDLAVEHILAGQTPLYGAAKKGHYHICKFLIESGAVVNSETMVSFCAIIIWSIRLLLLFNHHLLHKRPELRLFTLLLKRAILRFVNC